MFGNNVTKDDVVRNLEETKQKGRELDTLINAKSVELSALDLEKRDYLKALAERRRAIIKSKDEAQNERNHLRKVESTLIDFISLLDNCLK